MQATMTIQPIEQSSMRAEDGKRKITAAAVFDDLGKEYEAAFKDVPGQLRATSWLLDQLRGTGPASRILDVGSGTGKPTTKMLADAGHNVTGIDLSPKMIAIARKQVPQATFRLTNVLDYDPGPENPLYDAVVTFFAFLDCLSRDDIRRILPRIISWIRPGGYFVWGTMPGEQWNETEACFIGRKVTVTSLSKEEYLDILRKNGLEILDLKEESFSPANSFSEEHLFICAQKQ